MANLKYKSITHDHNALLDKAKEREGFMKAYEDLEEEYALAKEILSAHARVSFSQETVTNCNGFLLNRIASR